MAFPLRIGRGWCSGLPFGFFFLSLSLVCSSSSSLSSSRGLLAGTGALHLLSRRLTIPSPALPLTIRTPILWLVSPFLGKKGLRSPQRRFCRLSFCPISSSSFSSSASSSSFSSSSRFSSESFFLSNRRLSRIMLNLYLLQANRTPHARTR